MKPEDVAAIRRQHIGRGLSLSYRTPLMLVRGEGQYMFDDVGKRYLDCVNNVNHVGHCHPKVVQAAAKQMAELNTNTRYLHPKLSEYLERLTARFSDPLSVCYFVNSGSEAIELALQLAKNFTGAEDIIAVEAAYHGNTGAAVAISEYKFNGPGGSGCPPRTHVVPLPCRFRGPHGGSDAGEQYARYVDGKLADLASNKRKPAAFICESMISVGGQIILPPGYLPVVYESVRNAGGVCIADEVQVGFGRPGKTFWGFELQGVTPDIVTLGKPIGNGHPLGAVITTPEIADAFDNGMEYFNTFGGNPVSCAVGLAVLDVVEKSNLQQHALDVGDQLLASLRSLRKKHELIGDVRGQGLFAGIELVLDKKSLKPAKKEAYDVVEEMKDRGILLSVDGPLYNVIKIKPPMVFTSSDVDILIENLDAVLNGSA